MYRKEDTPFYSLSPQQLLALLAWGEARGEGVKYEQLVTVLNSKRN